MATNKFDITKLLALKSFKELSESEKAFALNELGSESTYQEMYEVVQGTTALDEPKISRENRDKTFAAFDEKHQKESSKKRGIIWLKPFAIGLAAASLLVFIWLIGFSDLNQNQELAEKEPSSKNELKDTIDIGEADKSETESKEIIVKKVQSENESEPIDETTREENTLENEEFTLETVPTSLDDESIVAEKPAQPLKEIAEDIQLEETYSLAHSSIESKKTANNEHFNDSDQDPDEPKPTFTQTEALSNQRTDQISSQPSTISRKSTDTKQSLFKVKLPLNKHYTAY